MCDFVYDTKHGYMVSGILLKIWVYDTKMYDTKCKTKKDTMPKLLGPRESRYVGYSLIYVLM